MIPSTAVSDWITVSQDQIRMFADATGDHQWIHVDPARAAAESPYHATIAHGFLVLSLLATLIRRTEALTGVRMAINYGLNRVRFIAPVITGSRIRGRFDAASVEQKDDARKVVWNVTIESEAGGKPCCVAEWIVLYYP